jgi:hypothetical protein
MMPAEKMIVVTEGITDVLIMRALLNKQLTMGMRFFAAQGRESLVTLARNLLVHEGDPVFMVMDVATAELPNRDEMVAEAMRALSAIAAPGTFQVFVFTPEIEIVFFEAPDALQRAIGTTVPTPTLEEGRVRSKPVLHRLLAEAKIPNMESLIRKMDEQAIQSLSSGKQAAALREKVRAFCRMESLAVI